MDRHQWETELVACYARVVRALIVLAQSREQGEDAFHDALIGALEPGVIEGIRRADAWLFTVGLRSLRKSRWKARLDVPLRSMRRTTPPPTTEQFTYNALFPYSVEVCAVTQFHQMGAKPGGWGGHATLFINGAEIDPGASYPRLRLVADGTDLSDPDAGTGISVNKIFDNVTWVAIPGRDEFFRGGLANDQTLDSDFSKILPAMVASA